jgi:transcriptional regulator with XRE-family HTH domain
MGDSIVLNARKVNRKIAFNASFWSIRLNAIFSLTLIVLIASIRVMKLKDYLTQRKITSSAFAKVIGVETSTVTRLASGETVPSPRVMRAIIAATGGLVTPNDFFNLPSSDGGDVGPEPDASKKQAMEELAAILPQLQKLVEAVSDDEMRLVK